MTLVTLDDSAIGEHLARIDADGYTIVDDAIEPDLVVLLRDTIRRLERELDVQPRATAAEGHTTLRMYNLLAKDPAFQAMPVHPNVLPIAERLLDRGCLLSGMTAIDIGPGEHPQPMHGDDIVMARHLPLPHVPMMVTSMWALTDFTADNGGTRFVPGSHRFAYTPESPDAPLDVEVRALEMPAGSVMVFHGSLWHGGGANTTADDQRLRRERAVLPGLRPPAAEPVLRHSAARSRQRSPTGCSSCSVIASTRESWATSTARARARSCSASAWRRPPTNERQSTSAQEADYRFGLLPRVGRNAAARCTTVGSRADRSSTSSATARRRVRAASPSAPSAPSAASWSARSRPSRGGRRPPGRDRWRRQPDRPSKRSVRRAVAAPTDAARRGSGSRSRCSRSTAGRCRGAARRCRCPSR